MKKFTYNPNMLNCVISENGADIIASVDRRKGQTQDEQAAIARLFASAPELLEALEYLQTMPNDPRAHRAALDAIAKAKG